MSLNSILNIANSGLQAAQQQLRVVSDNVSNVNTPGYVRKIAEQTSLTTQGVGSGVEVTRIRLATDRFLQAASLSAGAEAARQGVRYELYDRIQSLFGDPGGDSGFFSQIDEVFSSFAASAEDPTSGPRRQDALFKAQAVFDEATRISGQIQAVREDADGRIQSAIEKANGLLQQIETLNTDIARATVLNGDASGAQTQQARLVDELSTLLDVQVTQRSVGGVSIRTGAGIQLAGNGAATLEYHRAGTVNAETSFNDIYVTEKGGTPRALADGLKSGEIKGLLELRDNEAPATAERLAELVTKVADELNRAHNANSSVPAPTTLTGRNVGQALDTALTGFAGRTTVAVVNPTTGAITTRADIVFSGSTLTINGTASTPASFLTDLNTALGGAATATFTNGALKITAAGANGVAVADDPTTPSSKAGRGFSHYFGLNDLVSAERPALFDTGLTTTSQHGFTPGETLTFRFTSETGSRMRDIEVAVPAGTGTVGELISALNNTTTGVGRYGTFALDGSGELKFTGFGDPAARMSVLEDTTTQVPSGVSVTELFGIGGGVRASRADGFTIRTDIRQSPSKLALAQLNLSATAGTAALSSGDGRGALLLADAGQVTARFSAAGTSPGGSLSVSRYASELSGEIGGTAASAKTRQQSAQALATEADARQSNYEGVNLDEELVLMTTYQQAFNASARLIQAAQDMYDTLLGMVR
ncbi:flagellar hook-associated protein FlgK [Brevundimonas subvibrioides]|uniref:Flagellar hook-associated protein 1 n=1 Tax=Brevundimonas subvibrioides (strain ATCC 15264 / DSM 4735 / LMG 14903 / NBRC 16000 / CB 81) TaxID=633149 RepID=D9QGE5_BRESC|nr:flagellar hook-associated protein FlgK [Brevundimonas subvibrioides]ADL00761.1 flagellar hook-associated protein FlgK [Brevundimonas subvibrioides ATCC 15264]